MGRNGSESNFPVLFFSLKALHYSMHFPFEGILVFIRPLNAFSLVFLFIVVLYKQALQKRQKKINNAQPRQNSKNNKIPKKSEKN